MLNLVRRPPRNVARLGSCHPHQLCQASFDHTCKIWDLRRPLKRQNPLKTLRTGGPTHS